jgi:hypothetical protein
MVIGPLRRPVSAPSISTRSTGVAVSAWRWTSACIADESGSCSVREIVGAPVSRCQFVLRSRTTSSGGVSPVRMAQGLALIRSRLTANSVGAKPCCRRSASMTAVATSRTDHGVEAEGPSPGPVRTGVNHWRPFASSTSNSTMLTSIVQKPKWMTNAERLCNAASWWGVRSSDQPSRVAMGRQSSSVARLARCMPSSSRCCPTSVSRSGIARMCLPDG